MEALPLHNHENKKNCEFGYDAKKNEASLLTPNGKRYFLTNTTLEEPALHYSCITGREATTDEAVRIEILEDQGKLEVVKVVVDDTIIFEPTKH